MPRVVDIRPRILPRDVGGPGLAEGVNRGLELLASDRDRKQALALREQEREEDRAAALELIEARGEQDIAGVGARGAVELEGIEARGVVGSRQIIERGEQTRETQGAGFELEAPQLERSNIFEEARIGIAQEGRDLQGRGLQADIERGVREEEGRNERARLARVAGRDSFPLRGLAGQLAQQGMVTTTEEAISVARGRDPGGTVRTPVNLNPPGGADTVRQFEPRAGGLVQSVEEARLLASMPAEDHVEIGLALQANPAEFEEYLEMLPPELAKRVESLVKDAARQRNR